MGISLSGEGSFGSSGVSTGVLNGEGPDLGGVFRPGPVGTKTPALDPFTSAIGRPVDSAGGSPDGGVISASGAGLGPGPVPDTGGTGVTVWSGSRDGGGVGGDVGKPRRGGGDDVGVEGTLDCRGSRPQSLVSELRRPLALSVSVLFQKSGLVCIKSGVWATSRRRSLSTMISSLYCMALRFGRSLSLAPQCSVGIQVSGREPMERSLTWLTGQIHILVDQCVYRIATFASIPIISARTLSGWKSPVGASSVTFPITVFS